MNKITKRTILISSLVLILTGVVYFAFFNHNFVETIKRKSAEILVYEYIPNQNYDIATRIVSQKSDSVYKDFRNKYRFHFQTIGVCSFEDSSKMILISEPPPYFEIDSLKSIFSKFTHQVKTKYHRMGYDGRATDIVIYLANATNENIDNLVARLSKELYLSDYKPFHITLPVNNKKVYFSKSNLDYQITLSEFNDWFLEQDEQFIQGDDTTKKLTVESIFKNKKRGVYFSKLPGFVAWAIAKNNDLKSQLPSIRQFTLDADLILGALADSATLVIIGRERESPIYELPPLNIESILLLASITEKELAQSLDINDFLAGKMMNGKDWCPTYLSKELENTEFGHLMTITDILLKDWSEKGTIKEEYYHYPEPGYYPFNRPLFKKLGLNELVYNWNSANAMYAIDLDSKITLYTLNRTGSLPVSYFNSQERSQSIGSQYENQAYYYFATLGNTDLARVVQYTALYQLFMDNGIRYSGDIHSSFPGNKPFLLLKPTRNLLKLFKEMSPTDIQHFADSLSKRNFIRYHKDKVMEQLKDNENRYRINYNEEQKGRIFSDVQKNNSQYIEKEMLAVKSRLNLLSEEQFEKLAKYLAYPRGFIINSQEKYNTMLLGRQVNQLMRTIGKHNLDILNIDLSDVKNFFVSSLSHSSARYLKTPSIIVTFNDFITTGGHNISSKISRVNSMTNYKKSNYKPTQTYEQEKKAVEQPITVASTKPAVVQKPTTENSVKPKAPTTKATTTSASKAVAKPSTAATISSGSSRARSSVISTSSRTQRGF